MSSCSLVIVHASLKNALLIGASESGGRTRRDKKIHDFHNFSNSGLKFYMRISECTCNRIMMKKNIDFLTHLQENLPLRQCETHSLCVSLAPPREPLKLSLLHSIVFHIALNIGDVHQLAVNTV